MTDALEHNVAVVFLRETRLSDLDIVSINRSNKHWQFFQAALPMTSNNEAPTGGTAVAVPKGIPAVLSKRHADPIGEWVDVAIKNMHLLSIYRRPGVNPHRWSETLASKTTKVTEEHVWICPECAMRISHANSDGLTTLKWHHLRRGHPSAYAQEPRKNSKKVPIVLTKELPKEQMAWTCPLCQAGHPTLPLQDHLKAVRHHCKTCHPEETLNTLAAMIAKGKPKTISTVSDLQLKKHEKYRKKTWATHHVHHVAPTQTL